ncbi:branched-chain amino acid ABC transporter permease [Streptomyces sp. NPDC005708]|uniref:branched-chain amino acid ABC transporter permease n=1 Tax=Streptomyces sp. NPDC005708 TaxID=3154564 RepID=UPI003409CFA2
MGDLVFGTIYAVLCVSLNMQAGETGLMNFGLIGSFGIGAYATGVGSMHELPWLLSILIGMVMAAIVGALCGLLARALTAVYWALAMLAVAELIQLVVTNAEFTAGTSGISSVRPFFMHMQADAQNLAWLGVLLPILAMTVVVARLISRSQAGRVLRAVRENEDLAASLGHNTVGAKVRIMAVSAPFAALAGSLYTHYLSFIGPQQLDPFWTFLVFTMLVVGGMGNIGGAVLGAFLVQMLYDVTRFLSSITDASPSVVSGLRILVVGAALLGFLHLRPRGLVPERLRRLHA